MTRNYAGGDAKRQPETLLLHRQSRRRISLSGLKSRSAP